MPGEHAVDVAALVALETLRVKTQREFEIFHFQMEEAAAGVKRDQVKRNHDGDSELVAFFMSLSKPRVFANRVKRGRPRILK